MYKYILKRLLWMIPIVLGVGVIVFTILYFSPGDPAALLLPPDATDADKLALRHTLGLDQSYFEQLFTFLKNTFIKFDLGSSWVTNATVSGELIDRVPRTLLLTSLCLLLSVVVGVPIGILAAVKQNRWQDQTSIFFSLLGVSLPNFWLALLLVLLFSVKLHWLPAMGMKGFEYYILPALAGGMGAIAMQARQTRSSMLEVIRSDYITTARAKGVKEISVIFRHALPNALIPVITLAGITFGTSMGGTIILESIFAIPGVGLYIVGGIGNRDLPIVRGGSVFLAIAFSLCMLLVDIIYSLVDPRIKAMYSGGRRRKKHAKV